MAEDQEVPFSMRHDAGRAFRPGEDAAAGVQGPTIRENVDAGVKVIDLQAMIAELEAGRAAGGR